MKKFIGCVLLYLIPFAVYTQELEPRVYANIPNKLNAVAAGYGLSKGNVLADPSLPVSDLKIRVNSFFGAYLRSFSFFGKTARVLVTVPFASISGSVKLNGVDTAATRNGIADSRLRLSWNLVGSPALDKKSFRQFTQKTIVGVSFVTSIPTGYYLAEKRINIGSNRWAFKPEVGVSHRLRRFYGELYTGIWFYSTNTQYLGNKTLKQEPVVSIQSHISYYFKKPVWIGVNLNYFNGGSTIIDGKPSGDLLDNWRIGLVLSVPLAPAHSLKFQFHVGALTNTGYDYNFGAVVYQFVFF